MHECLTCRTITPGRLAVRWGGWNRTRKKQNHLIKGLRLTDKAPKGARLQKHPTISASVASEHSTLATIVVDAIASSPFSASTIV